MEDVRVLSASIGWSSIGVWHFAMQVLLKRDADLRTRIAAKNGGEPSAAQIAAAREDILKDKLELKLGRFDAVHLSAARCSLV